MIAARIRAMRGPHWLALFALILGAWAFLYMMSAPADLRGAGRVYGAEFWEALCTLTPDAAGFFKMVLMWALMSAAMMAPTALPAFATYEDLATTGADTRFAALVGGYLAIWLGFSVVAAGVQLALFGAGLLDPFGTSVSTGVSAGLLAMAGVYQFTPLKDACLSKCRMPLTFFMQHWDEGAFRNGLRLGAVCLGCCWALMTLAFVGGVMSLGFMALATVLMALEKLPDIGRWLTRPLGIALLAGAAWVAVNGI